MSRTILVPLDGSPVAEAALPYAEKLAEAMDARLMLLSVVDEAMMRAITARVQRTDVHAVTRALTSPIDQYLDEQHQALRGRGREVATRVATGPVAETIVSVAEDLDAKYIVMASHGRGGVQRWMIGSVADKVMRTSTRPTLLVRAPATGAATAPIRLDQIAVPLDGSEAAEAALPMAVDLALALDARITLLRVEPYLYTLVATTEPTGYIPDMTEMDNDVANAAQQYLDGVQARIPQTVPSEAMLVRGTPSATLIELLARDSVDLVVMTTHGRGGVRRLVLGSVADRLVRSGAPVLLIRPPVMAAEHAMDSQEVATADTGR
jgi:nucleotide-binding universal stress UspA family protein